MSNRPITGLHYERIEHGWKRQVENGTEVHFDLELSDCANGAQRELLRQLQTIRGRLQQIEGQPLAVADQLTTLDQRMTDLEKSTSNALAWRGEDGERIDNIEKHCEAMDGRIAQLRSRLNSFQPDNAAQPKFEIEKGIIDTRLERWPEGLVLWHHGAIVWRSWKYRD